MDLGISFLTFRKTSSSGGSARSAPLSLSFLSVARKNLTTLVLSCIVLIINDFSGKVGIPAWQQKFRRPDGEIRDHVEEDNKSVDGVEEQMHGMCYERAFLPTPDAPLA